MDLTVTLGDIIAGAGPIVAIVGAYMKLSDRLRVVEIRSEILWRIFERRIKPRDEEENHE